MGKHAESAGQFLDVTDSWMAWSWAVDNMELYEILDHLQDSQRITQQPFSVGKPLRKYKIAPHGWFRLEELQATGNDSQQGFVAMWFDSTMENIYTDVIAKAIDDAGYTPHRVDKREYTGKIDDEIIAQIRRSRFVIADFTGQRGGVYFEAGFAKGLGREVFWTCRKNDIPNLHFDIRQYNCIDWEENNLPEFRRRLASRIESVLGHGAQKPCL